MGVLRRGRAQSSLAALVLLGALAGAGRHSAALAADETAFEEARPRDDLAGVLSSGAPTARIRFHATAGSKLSAVLSTDTRSGAAGAPGLAAALSRGGTDLAAALAGRVTTGTDGSVRWKNVVLDTAGDYDVTVSATGDGTWRLRLAGAIAVATATSTTTVAAAGQDEVAFEGVARGTASFDLSPVGAGSKFKGRSVRIVQPDDTDLPGIPTARTGRVTLVQDGTHRLVYTNVGAVAGRGRAKVTVRPPRAVLRTGFLGAAGTAFVPVPTRLSPPRGFHRDDAMPLTVLGRDFQAGAEVRLRRNGRTDVVATGVDVRSETQIDCVVDLDTTDTQGTTSVGAWRVVVTNDPGAADPRTAATGPVLTSLASSSIRLPAGVQKGTEVWVLDFNDDFQSDLDRIGLGSADATTRAAARNRVERYVLLHLRDLFRVHETTGAVPKAGTPVPVCFVLAAPGRVAGRPGVDYNRIEIGGEWQSGDPRDPAEPLFWGASGAPGSEIDVGNVRRDDLSVLDSDGNRIGLGARTAVLALNGSDPRDTSWNTAMAELPGPLTADDVAAFDPKFFPRTQAQADRYAKIVRKVTRASREIAAIVAHHVGKAMGAEDVASGTTPMANLLFAGGFWPDDRTPAFTPAETTTLRANVVPHALPGRTSPLTVAWFPLVPTHSYRFGGPPAYAEECTTGVPYQARFGFVGGRPTAVKAEYRAQYVRGWDVPLGLTLSYDGLTGTAPLWLNASQNLIYAGAARLRIAVTDVPRAATRFFEFRVDIVPDPANPAWGTLSGLARNARDTVRNMP